MNRYLRSRQIAEWRARQVTHGPSLSPEGRAVATSLRDQLVAEARERCPGHPDEWYDGYVMGHVWGVLDGES